MKQDHPPLPKGSTLDWADHVDRLVEKGEITKEEGEIYKRRVMRDGIRRTLKPKSSK